MRFFLNFPLFLVLACSPSPTREPVSVPGTPSAQATAVARVNDFATALSISNARVVHWLLKNPIVSDYWDHWSRPELPAAQEVVFAGTRETLKEACYKPKEMLGDVLYYSRDEPPVPICHQPCQYRVRKNLKRCRPDQKFVSLADLDHYKNGIDIRDVAVGAHLVSERSQGVCQVWKSGDNPDCCHQCYEDQRLQVKNEKNKADPCTSAALSILSDYTLFPHIYEKIGVGDCCALEAIDKRVVVSGDIFMVHPGENGHLVDAFDVCFLDEGVEE